jgi:hypothetical protein
MKPESKFWQQVKKNTPKIKWTRLESWTSFGVPDLLGYHEVKPAAPRFAILYESSAINDLRNNINDAKITAQDDWTAIQDALINYGKLTNS